MEVVDRERTKIVHEWNDALEEAGNIIKDLKGIVGVWECESQGSSPSGLCVVTRTTKAKFDRET